MGYASTVINSSTPNTALMDWLDTQMQANGWTFVETWTSSNKVANVYKSPAASNSVGTDFYVATYRASTTSTAGVQFLLFEDWDAVNKKARKYAPAAGTGITVNAADGTVTDATGVLLDSGTLLRFSSALSGILTQVSVATTYRIDVTVNRVIVGSSSIATAPVYVGVFDSLLPPTMDPVPLVNSRFSSGATPYAASTREPGAPAASSSNFMVTCYDGDSARGYAFGPFPTTVAQDLYRGYESPRIWFASQRLPAASKRGIYQGVVTAWVGGAPGDTLTETRDDGSTRSYVLVQVGDTNNAAVFIRTA